MRRAAVLVVIIGLAAAGCTGATPEGVPAAETTNSAPRRTVGLSDADHGRTVTVAAGQRVTVILHSSEFVFAPPTNEAVLRADGPPTVTASPPTCVEEPGSGCGTVVASFVGQAPGDAQLVAERPGCALPECGPSDARWRLAVRVVDRDQPGT